jgi:hypothetical protein
MSPIDVMILWSVGMVVLGGVLYWCVRTVPSVVRSRHAWERRARRWGLVSRRENPR